MEPIRNIDCFYLCGPMTGIPEHNFPAFNKAAASLRRHGYRVVNPAEMDDGNTEGPWAYFLRRDLAVLLDCQAIFLLEGWEASKGANLELTVALALGMPIFDAQTTDRLDGKVRAVIFPAAAGEDFDESNPVTAEAERIVFGGRQGEYGHPYDDFSRTAGMWTHYLGHAITPVQVAICMTLVKISRHVNKPKRDNLVDGVGYLLCAQRVHSEEARRAAPAGPILGVGGGQACLRIENVQAS